MSPSHIASTTLSTSPSTVPLSPTMPHSHPPYPDHHRPSLDPPSSATSSPSPSPHINSVDVPTSNSIHSNLLNVVVTGGSSGIGAATVRAFAQAGHRVLFTYLTGYPRAHHIQRTYPNATPFHLDQADISSVASFALATARWAGPRGVHVLINNAALGSATVQGYVNHQSQDALPSLSMDTLPVPEKSELEDTPTAKSIARLMRRAAADEALVKVNALGPLWVTDALIDLIRVAADSPHVGRAVVIFISSVGGGSSAVFPEYCPADLMSKAAMTYLSKHVAARYVRHPVDVMCVSPGACETEMFKKSTLSNVDDVHAFIDSMPKRRLIQPDDMASTILWLATKSPPGLFHGANLDASMGLAVRPGLQTETENMR